MVDDKDDDTEKPDLHQRINAMRNEGDRWFHVKLNLPTDESEAQVVAALEESLYSALFTAIEAINIEMGKQPPETRSGIIVPTSH